VCGRAREIKERKKGSKTGGGDHFTIRSTHLVNKQSDYVNTNFMVRIWSRHREDKMRMNAL
jgi:hypothetical protein